MKKTLLYLAALAGFTACVQDLTEDAVVTPAEENGPVLTINASVDDTQTRVMADESGLNFKFEEGADRIGVFFYNGNFTNQWLKNVAFKAGAADEEGNFDFTQEESMFNTSLFLTQDGTQIFGYAPYSAAEASLGGGIEGGVTRSGEGFALTRNFSIPSQQKDATDARSVAKYYTVVAKPVSPEADAEGNFNANLSFSGIFSLIKFTVVNRTNENIAVNGVKFTVGENEALTGLFTAALHVSPKFAEETEDNPYTLTPVEGRTNNCIEMTLSEPVTLANDEKVVLYGVVNSGTYAAGAKLEVMATSDGRNYIYSIVTDSEKTLTRKIRGGVGMYLYEGEGQLQPSEGIEVINNVEDLKAFAAEVNDGDTKSGKTVVLTADLDLANEPWTPIGQNADGANKFQGTFDGQGHTISGLKVNQGAGYHAAGLFGALNGTVQDLVIDGAEISNISEASANGTSNGTAVVAGSIYTSGLIQNVTVKNATVNGNRYVGGIAGYVYGKIEGCSVIDSHVTATCDELTGEWDNGDKVGGIAGYFPQDSDNYIRNCSVENTDINGYRDIGGIAGYAADEVSDCTVKGVNIFANSEHNYKDYTSAAAYDANAVVGEGTAENSTISDVTVTVDMAEGLQFVAATDAVGVTTEEYQISNEKGLVAANDMLFPNANGHYYKLMADIVMTNVTDWESKMAATAYFTLDGNGYAIKKWHSTTGKALLAPTFKPAGNVTIKNLKLEGCSVEYNPTDSETAVGLLAGWGEVHNENTTILISECQVYNCDVISNANFGGAYIGYANGKGNLIINGCSTIESEVSAGGSVGGFIGYDGMNSIIQNCAVRKNSFTSADEGDWRVGAIVGTNQTGKTEYIDNNIPLVSDKKTNTYTQVNGKGHSDAAKTYGDNDVFNYAFGRYTNDGDFTVEGKKVIKGGATGSNGEAYVFDSSALDSAIESEPSAIVLTEGSYTIPEAAKGKNLSFVGMGDAANTVIDVAKTLQNLTGSTATFENVTLKLADNASYTGFQHMTQAYYKDCVFEGQIFLYCDSTFENCTFKNTGDNYNVWTYGTNPVFNGCTFNCDGKAVLIYTEAAVTNTITFNECVFNDSKGDVLKAAIEIGESAYGNKANYTVKLNNCEVNGFNKTGKDGASYEGDGYGDNRWGNKNLIPADRLNVFIDGTEVY